ncbi:MAG TPA: hypothetical protein VMT93_01090, partial [Gemmatimonadaceae bacterium]|nr:hypothetical protein [Gemmatimonadaceae bacterium]
EATRSPSPPVLRVKAPEKADVTVDGVAVGSGNWRSDSLSAGAHVVVATLPSVPGCASARQEWKGKVGTTGTTTANLTPRACGYLTLDAQPKNARYELIALPGGGEAGSGGIKLPSPLVLPSGPYRLSVSAPYCAEFRGKVVIKPGETHRERVRLICR